MRARGTFAATLNQAALLLAVALVCSAVSNALAGPERRLAWVGRYGSDVSASPRPRVSASQTPAGSAGDTSKADRPWTEISTDEALGLFGKGVLFLDARRTSDYRAGHIRGARSFPVWEDGLDEKVRGFYGENPDQDAPIVVYCSGGDCEDSHTLGQKLYLAGFNRVLVYRNGFPDWERRKLPVERGMTP